MSEFLLTPSARLSHEIEVKKSRFLTLVARVSTPAEAREVVNERKAAMPDARHHCAAFPAGLPFFGRRRTLGNGRASDA